MAKYLVTTTTTTTIIFLLLSHSCLLPCLSCPICQYSSPPPPPYSSPPPPPKPKQPVACPPPPSKKPPTPPKPSPSPSPSPPTPTKHNCPIDILKFDPCVDALGILVHIGLGKSAEGACCPLVNGLAGLDAGLCLCTAIKAKLLNLILLLPIALEVLLDCGKRLPEDYKCPV